MIPLFLTGLTFDIHVLAAWKCHGDYECTLNVPFILIVWVEFFWSSFTKTNVTRFCVRWDIHVQNAHFSSSYASLVKGIDVIYVFWLQKIAECFWANTKMHIFTIFQHKINTNEKNGNDKECEIFIDVVVPVLKTWWTKERCNRSVNLPFQTDFWEKETKQRGNEERRHIQQ